MRLREAIFAYGTSEGVTKAWDSRGRGKNENNMYPTKGGGEMANDIRQAFKDKKNQMSDEEVSKRMNEVDCIGPNCGKPETELPEQKPGSPPVVIPHLDNIEFQMSSGKQGQNIHFGKEELKSMLRMALVQLDQEDHNIKYLNSNMAGSTDHYATIKFNRQRQGISGSRQR